MKALLLNNRFFLIILMAIISANIHAENISSSPNGIKYPAGLKNWRIISTSYRNDNNTQRAILGNSIAINAARTGQTNPWPQGTVIAKLVWKNSQQPLWDSAVVPGEFVHSEIMIKDSTQFKTTKGWGYARWKGVDQQPYGNDASFAQECFSCHKKATDNDYVFTIPAKIP